MLLQKIHLALSDMENHGDLMKGLRKCSKTRFVVLLNLRTLRIAPQYKM